MDVELLRLALMGSRYLVVALLPLKDRDLLDLKAKREEKKAVFDLWDPCG